MEILYSNILPLNVEKGKSTFIEKFNQLMKESNQVDIAVGYISKASIIELDKLSKKYNTNVNLVIGMYYMEGIPESTYNTTLDIAEIWKKENRGSIRLVKVLKYHGKLYVFYKNGKPSEAFIGSHNLGAIKLEASNIRQYEISVATDILDEVEEIADFICRLKEEKCSDDILYIKTIKIIREMNNALVGQEYVTRITSDEVEAYKNKETGISFEIPLKVPKDKNDPHLRGSNINVCYASGRKRVWWETEIIVGTDIKSDPDYPEYQQPFVVITDDGWKFVAWTCGQNNKNLYSKDDLKIMGRWLKGRLVAAGVVNPVNNISEDKEQQGVITEEMLERYGRKTITLTKTSLTSRLDDGSEVPVWILSFLPESMNKGEFDG